MLTTIPEVDVIFQLHRQSRGGPTLGMADLHPAVPRVCPDRGSDGGCRGLGAGWPVRGWSWDQGS